MANVALFLSPFASDINSSMDPERDRPLAVGEDIECAMALTTATDILDLKAPDTEP